MKTALCRLAMIFAWSSEPTFVIACAVTWPTEYASGTSELMSGAVPP